MSSYLLYEDRVSARQAESHAAQSRLPLKGRPLLLQKALKALHGLNIGKDVSRDCAQAQCTRGFDQRLAIRYVELALKLEEMGWRDLLTLAKLLPELSGRWRALMGPAADGRAHDGRERHLPCAEILHVKDAVIAQIVFVKASLPRRLKAKPTEDIPYRQPPLPKERLSYPQNKELDFGISPPLPVCKPDVARIPKENLSSVMAGNYPDRGNRGGSQRPPLIPPLSPSFDWSAVIPNDGCFSVLEHERINEAWSARLLAVWP